jgi:sugar phosphate isomerase/epimerase
MRYSRREIGTMAVAGLILPRLAISRVLADTRFNGVMIGVQTYSFRALPTAASRIAAVKSMGISSVELMSGDAEGLAGAPSARGGGAGRGAASEAQASAAEALRTWRMTATDDTWKAVRKQVNDAGAELRILCYNMNVKNTSDEEIDYAFRMARAMEVKAISSSTQNSMAPRLVPFLDKYKIPFAFHGHASVNNPDETSTEATFERVMNVHPLIRANLDIGHYVVAGGDPVAFLNKHQTRVTNLHLKDRTKAGGNVAFGLGETPIKDVLQLLKKMKWDIPANVEFEYQGDPLVEVPKCIQYCKDALA